VFLSFISGGTLMNGKFWGNVGLSAVVLSLVAFAVAKISASPSGIAGVLLPEITVSDSVEELLHSVVLTSSSVKVPKTGHMVDASFTIANKGAHDIKNVAILCTLFSASGKEMGRDKWVVFKTVKSQSTEPFTFSNKKFISNSIVRFDCEIVDMQIAKAPKAEVHHNTQAEHGAAPNKTGHGTKH
jgi:hypothetical protein